MHQQHFLHITVKNVIERSVTIMLYNKVGLTLSFLSYNYRLLNTVYCAMCIHNTQVIKKYSTAVQDYRNEKCTQ